MNTLAGGNAPGVGLGARVRVFVGVGDSPGVAVRVCVMGELVSVGVPESIFKRTNIAPAAAGVTA